MSRIFNYFDRWKDANLACQKCNWEGRISLEDLGQYRELLDFRCPKCKTILAMINHPTLEEINANWANLNEEEKRHYGKRLELDAEFQEHSLRTPSQLPDIEEDPIVLVWDWDTSPGGEWSGPTYTVIKHHGRSIWRERAHYECVGRFGQVVEILRKKYGDRLKDIVPTTASETYLGGDDLRAWTKVAEIRQRMSPDSVDPQLRLHALAQAEDMEAVNFLRYQREIADHCLRSEEQLPDIDGEFIVLAWNLAENPSRVNIQVRTTAKHVYLSSDWSKESGVGFLYLTLSHDGHVIWREAASLGNPGGGGVKYPLTVRYEEIADILKRKYGERIKDLVPTYVSRAYCNGLNNESLIEARKRCFSSVESDGFGPAIERAIEHERLQHGTNGYLPAQVELTPSKPAKKIEQKERHPKNRKKRVKAKIAKSSKRIPRRAKKQRK